MNHKIDRDTYIIPPNFIESGTFFGGMFKARNVIEAGILAFAIGVPVFSLLPLGLTARIIALCLTALPAALVALIGISGESLSSFLLIFIKYLRNRRIVGGNSAEDAVPAAEHGGKHIKKKAHKPDKAPRRSRRSGREDFPAEFDEVRSYEIRQKLRPVKKQKPAKEKKAAKQKKKVSKERKVKRPIRTQEPKPACLNPVADYLPISKIENGIIYTKDHRYVKVVEVVPINFMLRSAQEQRNIIYSFVSYLKISPIKLQIKVLTRRAEINRHLDTVRKEMEQETNEQCLLMQEDYLQFVQQIGSREAITRRFFLIFEYEPWSNTKRSDEEGEAINALQSAVHTATNYHSIFDLWVAQRIFSCRIAHHPNEGIVFQHCHMTGNQRCVNLHTAQNLADRGIGLDDLFRQPDRQHRDIHIGIDNDGFPLVPGQGFGQNTAEHGFAAAGASPDGDNFTHNEDPPSLI